MAGKVLNIKVCIPLKLRSGLTGNYHAICHYSYNLPLGNISLQNLIITKMDNKMKLSFLIWLMPLTILTEQIVYSTNRSDTISFNIDAVNIYPCKKGKNTVTMTVTNRSNEKLIFALHIQSNIRISSSVGRGWGTVFFDTIPSGNDKKINHSFPFYSDLDDGITLRLQFYQFMGVGRRIRAVVGVG